MHRCACRTIVLQFLKTVVYSTLTFKVNNCFCLFKKLGILLISFQLWNELCDLIAKNPDKVTSLKIEPIIRQGLKRYTDQIGILWNSLADYYIRGGHFERARDIYEEAIQTVITVRDFTQVFDAYAQFEKNLISAKMEAMEEAGPSEEGKEQYGGLEFHHHKLKTKPWWASDLATHLVKRWLWVLSQASTILWLRLLLSL